MTQREYDCWHCLNSWLLVEKRGYLGVTRTNDGMIVLMKTMKIMKTMKTMKTMKIMKTMN